MTKPEELVCFCEDCCLYYTINVDKCMECGSTEIHTVIPGVDDVGKLKIWTENARPHIDVLASPESVTIIIGNISIYNTFTHDGKEFRVVIFKGDEPVKVYEDRENHESLTQTTVTGAGIDNRHAVIATRVVSYEGDAPRTFTYKYTLTGELVETTETIEYEGGEPGSTIYDITTMDKDGHITKRERKVTEAE